MPHGVILCGISWCNISLCGISLCDIWYLVVLMIWYLRILYLMVGSSQQEQGKCIKNFYPLLLFVSQCLLSELTGGHISAFKNFSTRAKYFAGLHISGKKYINRPTQDLLVHHTDATCPDQSFIRLVKL